jgi:hypothetical protein
VYGQLLEKVIWDRALRQSEEVDCLLEEVTAWHGSGQLGGHQAELDLVVRPVPLKVWDRPALAPHAPQIRLPANESLNCIHDALPFTHLHLVQLRVDAVNWNRLDESGWAVAVQKMCLGHQSDIVICLRYKGALLELVSAQQYCVPLLCQVRNTGLR